VAVINQHIRYGQCKVNRAILMARNFYGVMRVTE